MSHTVSSHTNKIQPEKYIAINHIHQWNKTWRVIIIPKYVAAAAAAKSLQSCPTLCDPIDGSPPGSSIPGILQARIL